MPEQAWMDMRLDAKQAFDAAIVFLCDFENQNVGDLLHDMDYGVLYPDGHPATGDSGAWTEWLTACRTVTAAGYQHPTPAVYRIPGMPKA